jgi:hypothetical protein
LVRVDIKGENFSIGDGLFCRVDIMPRQVLGEFIGDIVSGSEYQARVLEGRGGYGIGLRKGFVLDCFNYRASCMMSCANTTRNCKVRNTNRRAIPNAKLVTTSTTARLTSRYFIKAGEEITYPYSSSYIIMYPDDNK